MTKIEEKRQRIAAAELRIARLKGEISRQARADDTRRKILIGSFIIATASGDLSRLAELRLNGKSLDEFLSRPADRRLFGLPSSTSDGLPA